MQKRLVPESFDICFCVSSLFWHFSKFAKSSSAASEITHKTCIKFITLDIKFFYVQWIKNILKLSNVVQYSDQDCTKMIWFCIRCYLWNTWLIYLEQKFNLISMVFGCDDFSTFRFSMLIDLLSLTHYPLESSYYSSELGWWCRHLDL